MLRHLDNNHLFRLYDSDPVLRLRNAKNLSDTRKMLARFKEYLNGYPPSPELAKGFLRQFARTAGLDDFHAHKLRHGFATDLLERGANIMVIQELLGHVRT